MSAAMGRPGASFRALTLWVSTPASALQGRHGEGALATKAGIREAEMHTALEAGERIQHFIVVRRADGEKVEYVVYLRVSWHAG